VYERERVVEEGREIEKKKERNRQIEDSGRKRKSK
jgi:hypothetical protein